MKGETMAYATEKDAVRNLQRYLRQLSYTDREITPPPVDGIFESVTRRSLSDFQRTRGMTQSGVADRATWDALYREYLASLERYSPPLPLYIFPRTPEGYGVSLGDEYFLVGIIQLLLNELRIIYDSLTPLVISGVYDAETEANVRDFQSKNRLDETGKVDKATWNKLTEAYRDYAADYVR